MTDSKKPSTPETSSWFDAMLSRRELAIRAAAVAAGVTVLGTVGCSGPKEESEDAMLLTDFNSLKLQQDEGWNFGAESQELKQKSVVDTDVAGSDAWRTYASAAALSSLFTANSKNAALQNNTLLEVLDKPAGSFKLGDALKPIHDEAQEEAYHRGVGLANTIARSGKEASTLVILDLEGPQSVATAAGMASRFEPVLHLDNWPHPKGLVESQNTLGALLYFAKEFDDISNQRPANAPAVLVLDRSRLTDAPVGPDTFDNRYGIGLPAMDDLKAAGIEQVLYVVPTASVTEELDDLNEDFSVFSANGLPVEMIAIDEFKAATPEAKQEVASALAAAQAEGKEAPPVDSEDDVQTTATEYHEHRHYHYGGSPFGSFWFWMYMMSFRPPMFGRYHTPASPVRPRAQAYRPAPRPTQFGTRYSGTKLNGVGRQRPTGLGRVTAPVNARTGRVEGGAYGAAAAAYAGSRSRVGSAPRTSSGGGTTTAPRSTGTSSSGRGVYNTGG